MSKKQKLLGVATMLIIYFVIALVGFYLIFLMRGKSKTQQPSPSQIQQQTSPIPERFKTYESPKKQYSVSYPEKFTAKEQSYGFGVSSVELRSEDNISASSAADVQILTIPQMLAKAIGQDFETYYKMPDNSSKVISGQLKGSEQNESFTKVKNREINGHRAVEYTAVPTPNTNDQEAEIGVFIESGSNMIMFATGESQRTELEQMLATYTIPQ